MSDHAAALVPVVEALEALGVRYYIGGSVASSAHGVGRSTMDIDVIADLRPRHVHSLVQRLASEFYIDAERIKGALGRRGSFNLIHLDSMMKIDVFVAGERPIDRDAFARATPSQLFEETQRPFFTASAEDVVLYKLEWFRSGGECAQHQWCDVVGVLRIQEGALDASYLQRRAAEIGVSDLLDRALIEAQAP